MNKDVLINIKGVQKVDGDSDVIEMVTVGRYYKKNEYYYICYDESAATGFEGVKTTLKAKGSTVTLIRNGASRSQLVIEAGVRHQCQYGTEYGDLTIGVTGDLVRNELSDEGGKLQMRYSLDINTSLASENEIYISVLPNTAPPPQQKDSGLILPIEQIHEDISSAFPT